MNDLLKFGLGVAVGSGAALAAFYLAGKMSSEERLDWQEFEKLKQTVEGIEDRTIGADQKVDTLIPQVSTLRRDLNALADETWHVRAKFYETGLIHPRYRVDVWEKAEGIDKDALESIANALLPGAESSKLTLPQRRYTADEAARILEYYDLDEFMPEVQRQLEKVL